MTVAGYYPPTAMRSYGSGLALAICLAFGIAILSGCAVSLQDVRNKYSSEFSCPTDDVHL